MKSLLTLLTLFALTAGFLHAEPSVLGKIGEIEITSDEVRDILSGLQAGNPGTLTEDPAALSQYVRNLLVQRLILRKAVEEKLDQDPAVITTLVRAREAALTEAYLQARATLPTGYPSEAELIAAYDSAKEKLLVPKSYHLAQIYIAKDKAKLDATLKQLKAKGADFAAIAKATSEEPASAAKNGEIGWLTEEQIQPEIREKLPKLTLNTHSEPISLKDGWHIIKLLDIREAHTPPLGQIRVQLTARIRSERTQQLRQEFLSQLLRDHPAAINEIELGKLNSPPAPSARR